MDGEKQVAAGGQTEHDAPVQLPLQHMDFVGIGQGLHGQNQSSVRLQAHRKKTAAHGHASGHHGDDLQIHGIGVHLGGLDAELHAQGLEKLVLFQHAHVHQHRAQGTAGRALHVQSRVELGHGDKTAVQQQITQTTPVAHQFRLARVGMIGLVPGHRDSGGQMAEIEADGPHGGEEIDDVAPDQTQRAQGGLLEVVQLKHVPGPDGRLPDQQSQIGEQHPVQQGAPLHDGRKTVGRGKHVHIAPDRQIDRDQNVGQHVDLIGEQAGTVAQEHVPGPKSAHPADGFPGLQGDAQNPTRFLTHGRGKGAGKEFAHPDVVLRAHQTLPAGERVAAADGALQGHTGKHLAHSRRLGQTDAEVVVLGH